MGLIIGVETEQALYYIVWQTRESFDLERGVPHLYNAVKLARSVSRRLPRPPASPSRGPTSSQVTTGISKYEAWRPQGEALYYLQNKRTDMQETIWRLSDFELQRGAISLSKQYLGNIKNQQDYICLLLFTTTILHLTYNLSRWRMKGTRHRRFTPLQCWLF